MSSVNGHASKINTQPDQEVHYFQFRDPTTPPYVVEQFRDDEVTKTDLLTCWLINSLVKHEGKDQEGEGAFPSNAYIARKIRSGSVTHVSERINHLWKMGILIIIYHNGRRYLETAWSRDSREINRVRGEYGDKLREAHKRTQENLNKETDSVLTESEHPDRFGFNRTDSKEEATLSSSSSSPSEKSLQRPADAGPDEEPSEEQNKTSTNGTHPYFSGSQTVSPKTTKKRVESTNGTTSTSSDSQKDTPSPKKTKKNPIGELFLNWTDRLRRVASRAQNKNLKINQFEWARQFEKVYKEFKENRQRIDGALTYLEENWQTLREFFTINSPKHFGGQIIYLEKEMRKHGVFVDDQDEARPSPISEYTDSKGQRIIVVNVD